ncbi:MAG: dihydropteroate synthase [Candidatus Cloacimonadota bacterium]
MLQHRLKIMGILNITEDSFSDGGAYLEPSKALAQARRILEEGADIIDIGAESTRPGAREMDAGLEAERLIPIIQSIRKDHPEAVISVDTRKAMVAAEALREGAAIINDVSALRHDSAMPELLSAHPNTPLVLMHMQGEPQSMQNNPSYVDLGSELMDFFRERIEFCQRHGISRIILDPGIGFGKNLSHNLFIIANLQRFKELGYPVLLGASRKRFINEIYPCPTSERIGGSLAAVAAAMRAGLDYVRVHDVKASKQFIEVQTRILEEKLWAF